METEKTKAEEILEVVKSLGTATTPQVHLHYPKATRAYIKVALNRMVHQGKLRRLKTGVFAPVADPSPDEGGKAKAERFVEAAKGKKKAEKGKANNTQTREKAKRSTIDPDEGNHPATVTLFKCVAMVERQVTEEDGKGVIHLPKEYVGRTAKVVIYQAYQAL